MHFLDERFWFAISFFIFLYFVYKPIKKSILAALDAKIASIKMQVLEAKTLREEALALLKQTEQQIAKFDSLREKITKEAAESTKILIAERTQEIEQLLNHKKTEAATAIKNQKLQACTEIQAEFATIITKLLVEYFKSSREGTISDSEIAKHIMNNAQK